MEQRNQSMCDFELRPRFISEGYYFSNVVYVEDHALEVEFSCLVIEALFGYNRELYEKCLIFSVPKNPRLAGAFSELWYAAFGVAKAKGLLKGNAADERIEYDAIFNYDTGKTLIEKAKKHIVKQTIDKETARIVFASCIPTADFEKFEGYTHFDIVTALSILLLKEQYPELQRVKANVYLCGGITPENINFPVKVESTVDQRYIYFLINNR